MCKKEEKESWEIIYTRKQGFSVRRKKVERKKH
jgi:hypothetical protein